MCLDLDACGLMMLQRLFFSHPRPYVSCSRDFVVGRRVYAVVMPPVDG